MGGLEVLMNVPAAVQTQPSRYGIKKFEGKLVGYHKPQ